MVVAAFAVVVCVAQATVSPHQVTAGQSPRVSGVPAAARMNEALFFLLETDAEGVSEQSFSVTRNDAYILALTVSGESCGAYCETFTRDVSFDQRTGRLLGIDDLVTRKGVVAMTSMMRAERKRRYRAEARANRAAIAKTPASDAATREDLEQRLALNEGCVTESETFDVRYRVGESGAIIMTAGRCSNHASRALDDVGDVRLEIPAAKLDLTAYGRSLLAAGPVVPEPESPFGQVLHGRVGQAGVTMLLERPDGEGAVRGHYVYDKYQKPIELFGHRADGTLTLEEAGAAMVLTVQGNTLNGTWRGNGRELAVTLSR